MNIYTAEFKGHYPVGAVLLVSAESVEDALNLIHDKLNSIGLPQTIKEEN